MANIDLGETYGDGLASPGKQKYYPNVTVPGKIDPKMVGKTVTLSFRAKITGVRVDTQVGKKTKARFDVELIQLQTKPAKQGKAGGQYIQPWMDEVKG